MFSKFGYVILLEVVSYHFYTEVDLSELFMIFVLESIVKVPFEFNVRNMKLQQIYFGFV